MISQEKWYQLVQRVGVQIVICIQTSAHKCFCSPHHFYKALIQNTVNNQGYYYTNSHYLDINSVYSVIICPRSITMNAEAPHLLSPNPLTWLLTAMVKKLHTWIKLLNNDKVWTQNGRTSEVITTFFVYNHKRTWNEHRNRFNLIWKFLKNHLLRRRKSLNIITQTIYGLMDCKLRCATDQKEQIWEVHYSSK